MTYSPDTLHAQLEKLEQNITFTLQEIDTNFAACHQIVSTRVLKSIEKFAEASEGVWEGGKFWLSFFDALDLTIPNAVDHNNSITSNRPHLNNSREQPNPSSDDTLLSNPLTTADLGSPVQSTPGWQRAGGLVQSPWDAFKQQNGLEGLKDVSVIQAEGTGQDFMISTPSTAKANAAAEASGAQPSGSARLLSKVLNKEFIAAQQERDALLQKQTRRAKDGASTLRSADESGSTMTPPGPRDNVFDIADLGAYSDDDDDGALPYSPPITIQFALPPSKLVKTPAKIAAKTVVEEILSREGVDSIISTPLELPTHTLEKHGSAASKTGSDAPSVSSRWRVGSVPGSAVSRIESIADSEAPSISSRWKDPSVPGSAASKAGSVRGSEIKQASFIMRAGNTSTSSSRTSRSESRLPPQSSKYKFDDYDDDGEDDEMDRLLDITTKLSPFPTDKTVHLGDDEDVIKGKGSVPKKKTPAKADAVLDKGGVNKPNGVGLPLKADKASAPIVDDDENDDDDVDLLKEQPSVTSVREQSQRSFVYKSATPPRSRGNGSASLVAHDTVFDTYPDGEDEEEEDDDDIVNSPCPPGIWLNVGGYTPKGKSHSPFRLVGSPTLHRVMDKVKAGWTAPKGPDQSGVGARSGLGNDSDEELMRDTSTAAAGIHGAMNEGLRYAAEPGELTQQFGTWGATTAGAGAGLSSATKNLSGGFRSSPELSGSVARNLAIGPAEFRPEFDAVVSRDHILRDADLDPTGMSTFHDTRTPRLSFDLKLFPVAFQHPPGSTQLSQVYKALASSSTALTLTALRGKLNDGSFDDEKLTLFLDLLVRKKVAARSGDGWIV